MAGRGRHGHEPRHRRAGHLDAREPLFPVLVADQHGEVVAHVGDVRERPPGVERQRREHREDLLLVVGAERGLLAGVQPRVVDDVDAGGVELGQKLRPDLARLAHDAAGALLHDRQQLLRRVAVGRDLGHARLDLLAQAGDADHEELAEDRADDADELHALEQRVVGVAGLEHHALEEVEHAELAVDEERGVAQVRVHPLGRERRLAAELLVGRLGRLFDGLAAVVLLRAAPSVTPHRPLTSRRPARVCDYARFCV